MRPQIRSALLALLALLVTSTVLVGVGAAAPAHAATIGPGYSYQGDPHSHIGGFRNPDGTISYCIDAGKSSPVGKATTDQGVVTRVNGRSEAVMLQLSYVLARHGNTANDDVAAAVALVVWGLADGGDHAARGGDGFVITRAPADRRAHILSLAARFRAEAESFRRPEPGSARLNLSLADVDPAHGLLTVELTPVDATGALTLTNGVFADTGLPTRDGVVHGEQLAIDGVAPTAGSDYRVDVVGAFDGPGYPDGSVHLYTTPGAQSITASGNSVPVSFEAAAYVEVVVPRTLPRVAG